MRVVGDKGRAQRRPGVKGPEAGLGLFRRGRTCSPPSAPGGSSQTSPTRTQDAGHLWPVSQRALSCSKNLIFTNCPEHPQALTPSPGSPSSIRAQKRDSPTAKITPSEGCRLGPGKPGRREGELRCESQQGHRVQLHGPYAPFTWTCPLSTIL